ncbi:amino acid adenylation domain-containing protein [Micromonospora echinofusca]|uniref:Amino acid adenylation domain-containing protein n=1 Tax=Micromonospora echinofusca TaxID=47858 RepID=A0ABS3VVU4_MICEH|nr:amino acid adenylation domain-containing protein [Micromonospora echinofusca]MBO4208620.1 amino acid adenylation domain-containing protein [Micromonospora echinofusca]
MAKLTATDRHRVPMEWNDTTVRYPTDPCLHELVEEQVRRTPDAIAVVSDERTVRYAELDREANRLAHRLRAAGVGPESVVGVCLYRSVDLVVALLGGLKAGGAYLPVDPDLPADRIRYLLTDSGAATVVTGPGIDPRPLAAATGAPVPVDGDHPGLPDGAPEPVDGDHPGLPDGAPEPVVGPGNAAYVIYTSGSTGRPKGVVVEHRSIVNRVRWMPDARGADGGVVLQKTPFSFDVSVCELFSPLTTGATLVMARPGGHRDPVYLARVVAERQVTSIRFVPSMLRAFLDVLPADRTGLPSVRQVLCSGEALPADLVAATHERLDCEVLNLYGPTEAAVEVTSTHCVPGEPVTIGRPVANTRTYIVDADLRAVAVGETGELMLAGVQLARGYLGRPGLTATSFVPDPFAERPGQRMYRTGDLARYRPDGSIEYLGRLDHQVKIRGFRIELGEIESVLVEHPAVRHAVVDLRHGAVGGPQLVGYLLPAGPEAVDHRAVRAHLAERVPDYMVPQSWVTLDELPLTSSGKVDRKRLPEPPAAGSTADGPSFVAPRTPTEQAVAEVWAEVLGVDRCGVADDFFDLGGHSLLATQVIALLHERFPVDLPVSAVFEAPTVAELAAVLQQAVEERVAGMSESELETMLAQVGEK